MLDVELVVVYHLVPTSNHNLFPSVITILQLFIILFLHQTTTVMVALMSAICCLSSCSYIKPQLPSLLLSIRQVVYHLVPTSNHNFKGLANDVTFVVYHLVPTSNHNVQKTLISDSTLFIILFLHQTTTLSKGLFHMLGCLSSCSYIKPQLHRP